MELGLALSGLVFNYSVVLIAFVLNAEENFLLEPKGRTCRGAACVGLFYCQFSLDNGIYYHIPGKPGAISPVFSTAPESLSSYPGITVLTKEYSL
jgi:hypothetical protein